MLGIESEISIQAEVSRLSISSNTSRIMKEKNLSLNNASNLKSEQAASTNPSTNHKNEKIKILRNKMLQISRNQEMMDTRMKAYIGMIEKQVKNKEEQNRQLQNCINMLKEEISQSKADIQTLTQFILKKRSNIVKEEPRSLRSSNVNSFKNQIVNTINRQLEVNTQKSSNNVSPKNHLILVEKKKNTSPLDRTQHTPRSPREQKKITLTHTVAAPLQRKLKSPGK